MATTKSAMLMIKLSSSYVLIITTPSTGFSEWVGARPPATLVNTLFSFPPCPLWSRGGLYLFHDCQIWDETYRIIYKILNDIGAHTLFSFHSKNKVSPENYALLFYSENTYLCVLSDCAIFPYLFLRL